MIPASDYLASLILVRRELLKAAISRLDRVILDTSVPDDAALLSVSKLLKSLLKPQRSTRPRRRSQE